MSSSLTDSQVDVAMPQMGVSVAEGTIVEWRKAVGDWVERDETICEVTTDKIDVDIPAPQAGRLVEILASPGETVAVGTTIARLGAGGGAPANGNGSEAGGEATRPYRRYSPVVARIAERHGIDLSKIDGTGRGGRVRKQDVLAVIAELEEPSREQAALHIDSPYRDEPSELGSSEARDTAPPATVEETASGGDEAVPLSRMRRSIGEHMLRSLQTAAHCTTIVEVDMSSVERRRAKLGLSYLPFVARAVIEALREFPTLNATLEGDKLTTHRDVNLAVAVSLGEDGLIVPVIERAQELSEEGLAHRIVELARRARNGELTPDEVRGGTFTITNPGAFGAIAATPIINQPQVAILDLEAVVRRPVVVDDGSGGEAIAIRPIANLCLSWDHRALDGALAAQFLTAIRWNIEARRSH